MSFPVPEGIPSAITLPELSLLQRYAREAGTVLEIGTLYGFSCIGMALAGAHVTSVDPHNQGPANAPDTWRTFVKNVERHGFMRREGTTDQYGLWTPFATGGSHINAHGYLIEYFQFLPGEEFGLAFIDGDHVAPAPWRDIEIARAHLTAPGYIALHDVAAARWPDVAAAARRLVGEGWRELERAGCLRVYQEGPFGPGRCAICGAPDGIACRGEVHEDYQK